MTAIPIVFVFGTGRCGTHSLWKLFESVPGTMSTHEGSGILTAGPPATIGQKIAMGPMLELNAYLYHAAGEAVFRRTLAPDPELRGMLDRTFERRAKLIDWCVGHGIAYCDANPFAFNLIDYLRLRYPGAKFIHLVRDGYACVQSWARRGSTYPDRVPDLATLGYVLAKPVPFPSEDAYAGWNGFDRVQRISWFWAAVNANIIERFTRIPPSDRMLVRIEDFDETKADEVLRFCGLAPAWSRAALAPQDPSAGAAIDWTNENVRKFDALAGTMMGTLGYPLR